MIFEKALSLLKQGKRVRRTMWQGETRFVRIADPPAEPTLDGPEHVYAVYHSGTPISDSFDEEDAAKAHLTELRKSHTREWTNYKKFLKEIAEADEHQREKMAHLACPALPEEHYKDATIVKRDAPKKGRINVPMFLAMARNGSIFPYQFQTPDLLAEDWNEA